MNINLLAMALVATVALQIAAFIMIATLARRIGILLGIMEATIDMLENEAYWKRSHTTRPALRVIRDMLEDCK